MREPPWIGVDLDGTLAEYHGWHADGGIGEPVPQMLERVKQWRREGKLVKIVTARAYKANPGQAVPQLDYAQIEIIGQWCAKHLGERLPVMFWKDYAMVELWDDRAKQVEKNTGVLVEEEREQAVAAARQLDNELYRVRVAFTNELFRTQHEATATIERAKLALASYGK